jgi:hypothetical protein
MSQFEEIAHTGGKLTFIYEPESGISVKLEHSSPFAAAVFQVCIGPNGKIVDYVAIGGEGAQSFYPQPSVLAPLLSDKEGMFGQKCKSCESYFRTSVPSRATACPYCGIRYHAIAFLTPNQLQYLAIFFNTYMEALKKAETRDVDLDAMIDALANNTQSWVYKEERQQSKNTCPSCRCVYDVLGKYALCPSCAKPNYERSLQEALGDVQARLTAVGTDPSNVPGELFAKIFTEYEALANAVRRQLLRFPATGRRRHAIEKINFQKLDEASKLLEQYFAINVYDGLSRDDIVFLNLMVNRRHILIHGAGHVDERYLQVTQDSSVRLNETTRIGLADATRTINVVQKCGMNLIRDWQSIK